MTEEILNNEATPDIAEDKVVDTNTSNDSLLTGEDKVVEAAPVVEPTTEEARSFIDSLPQEHKAFIEKKGFKDVGSIVKSLENLESKFGKRVEDLTTDELKSIDSKFGAPDSADKYELNISDEIKDADPIFRDIHTDLHAAGIPKAKAEALMSSVLGKIETASKDREVEAQLQTESDIKSLQSEYGTAFEQRKELANNALREFGGQDAIDVISAAGLSSSPALFKMLSEVGKLISEDRPVGGKETKNFGITPDEANQQIADLRADPAFAERLRDVRSPGHNEALAKIEKLYRLRTGKK